MTKVITKGLPKESEVLLYEITMTYAQDPDCTEDPDSDWQKLIISTRSNGLSNFLNIQTDSWSIDDVEGISTVIEDFKKRINYDDED